MKRSLIIGLVVLLILPTVACNQGESLLDEVARAVTKTSLVHSYRSTGNSTSHTNGATYVASFEGEYAAPDRFHEKYTTNCSGDWPKTQTSSDRGGTVTVTADCNPGWAEMIIIGERGYVRSSDWPQWRVCDVRTPSLELQTPHPTETPSATPTPTPMPIPLQSPHPSPGSANQTGLSIQQTDNISPARGADWPGPTLNPATTPTTKGGCGRAPTSLSKKLELLNWLVDLEQLPDEEIDGVDCSHYRGKIDQDSYLDMLTKRYEEAYAQITPENIELMRQQEIVVELWIDGDDHIRQQRTEFRFPTSQEEWVTGFSITRHFDFNEPIIIEPPDIEGQ